MTDQMDRASELRELLHGINTARTSVHDAIAEGRAAWGEAARVPDGEESWSVRQIAEHVVENEYFFANQVSTLIGASELEQPKFAFESADEALAALHTGAATVAPVLAAATPAILEDGWGDEHSGADLLGFYAYHFEDHAAQIRAIVADLVPA